MAEAWSSYLSITIISAELLTLARFESFYFVDYWCLLDDIKKKGFSRCVKQKSILVLLSWYEMKGKGKVEERRPRDRKHSLWKRSKRFFVVSREGKSMNPSKIFQVKEPSGKKGKTVNSNRRPSTFYLEIMGVCKESSI